LACEAPQESGALLGIGALKRLNANHGEIKSMHVVESARGKGISSRILEAIIQTAREKDMTRVSLETHPGPYFAPAIALYQKYGFSYCGPFADYVESPNSVFMTLVL
jgi:putative acetyltransferase